MNSEGKNYDVAIVGGGLAGLAAAILLARKNFSVILFEKESYPFHKVCGEYISMESFDFLLSLGLPLNTWRLPRITQLDLSDAAGSSLHQSLPLGGIGISRFKLDNALAGIARESGVVVRESCRVHDVLYQNGQFVISSGEGQSFARVCCAAYGKRSNLDIKRKRSFINNADARNNYVGIKYHAEMDHPRDTISLHNFHGGYCGISPVEEQKTCICYLTTAENLRAHNNNIHSMERTVLFSNPLLKEAFTRAAFTLDKPVTISQISFKNKEQVNDHVLMLGDAAGMITPLCGNGMSMALLGSKMASELIADFLNGTRTREQTESLYAEQWKRSYSARLFAGRIIQRIFQNSTLSKATIRTMKFLPSLTGKIIRQTHG